MRGTSERDERRHVDVVAAGVHDVAGGAERSVGALGYRQPVELRAHRHRPAIGRTDAGDPPRARHRRARDGQLTGDGRGRPVLLVGRLGLRVQPVAQLDGARQLALDAREQLRECLSVH